MSGPSTSVEDTEKVRRKQHDVESAGFLRSTAEFWRSRMRKLFSKRKDKERTTNASLDLPITGSTWPTNLGFGHESTESVCVSFYLARRWAHPKLTLDDEETHQQSIKVTAKIWWLLHMLEGNIPCALPILSYRHIVMFYNVARLFQNVDFSAYQRLSPPKALAELVEYWMISDEFQALEKDHYPLDVKTLKHMLDERDVRCFELPKGTAIGQQILEWMEVFATSKPLPVMKTPEYVLKKIPKSQKCECTAAQELTDFFITFRPLYLSPEFLSRLMPSDFMEHLLAILNKLDNNVSAVFITEKEQPSFYNVSLSKVQVDIVIREFFLEGEPAKPSTNLVSEIRKYMKKIIGECPIIQGFSNCSWLNYDFGFLTESIIRPPRQFNELWDKFGKRFEIMPKANEPSTSNATIQEEQQNPANVVVIGKPAHHMRKVDLMMGRREPGKISSSESSMDRLYSSDSDMGMDFSFGADENMDIELPEIH